MSAKKVTINGKSYDKDTLSKEAKASLQSLVGVENELKRLEVLIAALQTARGAYARVLDKELNSIK